jgi:hypothetical protein
VELPSYFADFLAAIRLTENQVDQCRTGHRVLRERLLADGRLAPAIVSTFLQGSYRRATAVRPHEGRRADVDVIVVTRLSMDDYPDPEAAMEEFLPFLDEHYAGKYSIQGRSIGIHLSYVDLDLVITAAPSESELGILEADSVTAEETLEDATDWRLVKSWVAPSRRSIPRALALMEMAKREADWKLSPLYIPDREARRWERTHPLAQMQWTSKKNQRCDGHYVNVVKAIKWWRRVNHPTPKYPKGYPVEHLVGVCCPDDIASVAQGVTLTLEAIAREYEWAATARVTPFLPDHGVPEHNMFGRVSAEDFATFHSQVHEAAAIARQALDSDDLTESVAGWQKLFGTSFPDAPPGDDNRDDDGPKGGYTPRKDVSVIGGGRFA